MDQIFMRGLQFFAFHGVLDAEKELGQKFTVHVTLELDLRAAGVSDDLSKTVSYADLYDLVKHCVTEKRFLLLEALAEDIASALLAASVLIDRVTVEIEKPEAPVRGIFDAFGVKILRGRA